VQPTGPWLMTTPSSTSMVMQAAMEVEHPAHWLKPRLLSMMPLSEPSSNSDAVPPNAVMDPILLSLILTAGSRRSVFGI